jgi:antitoxin component of RelBE/YafQ-DinJ toxin-antitoxin module
MAAFKEIGMTVTETIALCKKTLAEHYGQPVSLQQANTTTLPLHARITQPSTQQPRPCSMKALSLASTPA